MADRLVEQHVRPRYSELQQVEFRPRTGSSIQHLERISCGARGIVARVWTSPYGCWYDVEFEAIGQAPGEGPNYITLDEEDLACCSS